LILAIAVAMALIGGMVYLVYRPVAKVAEDAAKEVCSL
jgi:hypothetical protein